MNYEFGRANNKMQLLTNRLKNMVELTMAKVAAHVNAPQAYPLPADQQSLEHAIYKYYNVLPKSKQKHFFDNANKILNAGETNRKAQFGDLATLDFKSNKSLAAQIKELPLPANMKLNEAEEKEVLSKAENHPHLKRRKSIAIEPQGVAPRTLSLFLESITCNDTSDVRKDEISITGIVVDALNRTSTIVTKNLGKFKKDDSKNNKIKLFDFDLREANTFPQSFFTTLFITDSDLFRNDNAATAFLYYMTALSTTLFAVGITLAAAMFYNPITDIIASIIIGLGLITLVIGGFGYLLTDDISKPESDQFIFTFPPGIAIGEGVTTPLDFEIINSYSLNVDGKYASNIRWERTA